MRCWSSYKRVLLPNIILVTCHVSFCNFLHYWKSCVLKYCFTPKSSLVVKNILHIWHTNTALLLASWIYSSVGECQTPGILQTPTSHEGDLSVSHRQTAQVPGVKSNACLASFSPSLLRKQWSNRGVGEVGSPLQPFFLSWQSKLHLNLYWWDSLILHISCNTLVRCRWI